MVMMPGVSGVACISTGTFRSAMRKCFRDGAFLAEIGQRDDDAVDLIADACETGRRTLLASWRVSTAPCLESSRAETRSPSWPAALEHRDHLFPAAARKMIGEEAAIPDNNSEVSSSCDFRLRGGT